MLKTHNGSLNYYSMGCCVQVLSHHYHNVIYVTSVRHRSNFVRERSNLVNRIQKVLEAANIKLASVATDIMGVSGRAMLKAIIAGDKNPEEMANERSWPNALKTREVNTS